MKSLYFNIRDFLIFIFVISLGLYGIFALERMKKEMILQRKNISEGLENFSSRQKIDNFIYENLLEKSSEFSCFQAETEDEVEIDYKKLKFKLNCLNSYDSNFSYIEVSLKNKVQSFLFFKKRPVGKIKEVEGSFYKTFNENKYDLKPEDLIFLDERFLLDESSFVKVFFVDKSQLVSRGFSEFTLKGEFSGNEFDSFKLEQKSGTFLIKYLSSNIKIMTLLPTFMAESLGQTLSFSSVDNNVQYLFTSSENTEIVDSFGKFKFSIGGRKIYKKNSLENSTLSQVINLTQEPYDEFLKIMGKELEKGDLDILSSKINKFYTW